VRIPFRPRLASTKNAIGIDKLSQDVEATVAQGIPMSRRATPDAVASDFLFLASEEAGFLTGVCLDFDGGRSTQFRSILVG